MASFNIHLAVGKRYIEKNKQIKNKKEFYKGIIDPDLVEDKKISHYTGERNKKDVLDYLFFNNFFEMNYLKNISYEDFCKDLYYSYDITNEYLENKYKIDCTDFSEQINKNIEKDKKEKSTSNEMRTNILEFNKIDDFIEFVSSIDLESYKNKIIENNCNVLPDNTK